MDFLRTSAICHARHHGRKWTCARPVWPPSHKTNPYFPQGVVGTLFIKGNLWWCRFRKFSKLGQYPVTEVMVVTLITAIISYPNPYTRLNMSQLIYLLFSQCGISNSDPLWWAQALHSGEMKTKIYRFTFCSDYNRNFTDVNSAIEIAAAGPGVYKAIWLLMLAFVVYLTLTIFTFGMKVPCGLFIPSLCLGAIMGRIVGIGKLHTLR